MSAITVNNISKRFRLPHHKKTTLFQNAIGLMKRQMTYEEFWALKDISFEVERGETFGIIGRNGSGKSTLLKMLARVLYPDSGSVRINGKVASFLELGVGFQSELTAAENIYIYASVLGMSHRETSAVYDQIFDFAELKKFQDMKLKNFSSGMYTRLAFSTAVNCNPDIMLVDEVLAVGDEAFQKKCMIKIHEFRKQGKTIIFVSHALDTIRLLCHRSLLIDNGRVISMGPTNEVIERYLALNGSKQNEYTTDEHAQAAAVPITEESAAAFKMSTEFQKYIGADHDTDIEAVCSGNHLHLIRSAASRSGIIDELRIRCASSGQVKLAIYADNNGEPGRLINAIASNTPVSAGWNDIVFPPTSITSGKTYWLAYCSNDNIVGAHSTSNSHRRFKPIDFSIFTFPQYAGSDFITDTTYYDLIAGWG